MCKRLSTFKSPSQIPKFLWQIDNPFIWTDSNSVHVDLGAGRFPRNPFGAAKLKATDFHSAFQTPDGVEFVVADLTRKLPFESGSVASFSAFDVLEHIPRWERVDGEITFPFIDLMSEIHRCLKPGGLFIALTPSFPATAAFQDPTHVNFISKETIHYFGGDVPWGSELGYGFKGRFNIILSDWLRGSGPISNKRLSKSFHTPQNEDTFRNFLRLGLRFLRMLSNRKPSHIIWILEKVYAS